MAKRSFDNVRGGWLALTAMLCLGVILGLGLGSERVRRAVRESLPASLGGAPRREPVLVVVPDAKPEEKVEEDPDALPAIPAEDSFRGLVKDSAGKPIPGAAVTAERWRESRWEVLGTARANGKGEFVLGPLPRAHVSAVARAEGYASERKPAKTGARLEFALRKGGALAGKVVDAATGNPVPDVYLSGWSGGGNWNEQARTGKDGAFRFLSVPPGRVGLNVVSPEHRETYLNDLEIAEGKETFKEIPLVQGGALRGRVVDRETKVPVPNARIRTWDGVKSATSGEDGRYEMKSWSPRGSSFKVSAPPDYPEQWTWLPLSGDPTQDVQRDIEVSRGCKVSGVVTRPDGSPAAGARVGREPGELMTGVPDNSAESDAEGRFVLESVPAWRGFRLFAIAEGFALSRSEPLELRPGVEFGGVRIQLQPGATFRGTVKDEEGKPLAAAGLNCQRSWTPADGGGGWYWIPEMVTYSGTDGAWELTGVPQGTWQIRANLEGYAPESRGNVNAPAEGAVEGQDFLLRRGSSITGRVRSLAGDLLAGVPVTAWGWVMGSEGRMEWVQRREVRTDEEGAFVLDGLRDGTYTLNLQMPGFAPLQVQGISTGSMDLQLTLTPTARLEGRVFEPDGVTPVSNFQIRVYVEADAAGNPLPPGNVQSQQDFADREGRFLLRDLPEGQVGILAVAGPRISRRLGGLVTRAGSVSDGLRLTVAPGGKLRVIVRDSAGTPLPGAQVSAGRRQPDGSFANEAWAQADPEGVASFAAMADGTWTLSANHQNRVQESKTLNLGGGVEAEVEMALYQGGSILVQVRDGKGAPLEGVEIGFQDAAGSALPINFGRLWQRAWEKSGGRNLDWNEVQRAATRTDASGRLLRDGLRPGPVRVVASREGFPPATASAEVHDGFEIDLSVTMAPGADAPSRGGGK